jgi:hypothetical protein
MSYITNGGGLNVASTPPANTNSPGTPYTFAFDASGNLYICWAPNTWAKYFNAAPFGASGNYAAENGMDLYVAENGTDFYVTES